MSLPSPTNAALAGSERVGEILVKTKLLSEEQIRSALDAQKRSGKRLGKILVEDGFITETRLVQVLSAQLNIEVCDPITTPIHPRILELVPTELATEFRVVPLGLKRAAGHEILLLATADPTNHVTYERLERELGMTIEWRLCGETEIDLGIARHYGPQAVAPTVLGVPSVPPPQLVGTSLPLPVVPADMPPPRPPSVPAQSWADMVPGDSWPAPDAEPVAPTPVASDPKVPVLTRVEPPAPVEEEARTESALPIEPPVAEEAPTDAPAEGSDDVAEIVADTRIAVERFARNEEIDAATTSWVLRVAVAYLLEHGLTDPIALDRAVRTVLSGGASEPT